MDSRRPSPTFSLGFYFNQDVVLECVGHLFCEMVQRLLKLQKQLCGHALFHDVQKPSQNEGSKMLDSLAAATALKENLKQALSSLHSPHSTRARLWDLLESRFREEEVKLINKMVTT
ncbi:Ferritin Light Chain [Manis pentadactyla]|nr:Ferritin Light Chain [Manis pentadactyla]